MQASMERQRESVRKQQAAHPASTMEKSSGFFTTRWQSAAPSHAAWDSGTSDSSNNCDPITAPDLDSIVLAAADRESLKPSLLRAVIRKESAGRPCAVSPKGAQGLMQLMPETQSQLGVSDPFNPKQNIDAGARFLRQLIDRYGGDLSLALGAYNAGPGRVDATGRVPNIPETQDYVRTILSSLTREAENRETNASEEARSGPQD
jgi:hypothetical protein